MLPIAPPRHGTSSSRNIRRVPDGGTRAIRCVGFVCASLLLVQVTVTVLAAMAGVLAQAHMARQVATPSWLRLWCVPSMSSATASGARQCWYGHGQRQQRRQRAVGAGAAEKRRQLPEVGPSFDEFIQGAVERPVDHRGVRKPKDRYICEGCLHVLFTSRPSASNTFYKPVPTLLMAFLLTAV